MFCCIMVPFSIVAYASDGWKTPYIIAMEVVGVVCVPLFYVWERYFTPKTLIPYKYLQDRSIVGGCMLYFFMFASIL